MSEELTRNQDVEEQQDESGGEERGAALPEGRAGGRRGETARQLIRRAKQAIRAEVSVADLCRREGIHPTIYYKWLKDFMEAGKGRLRGDAKREATSNEVQDLRQENERLKLLVADLSLANLTLKKNQY